MPFIAAKDGTQLYWREWGPGAPILFLNSLGVGVQMWDYQMAAFGEQGFRCIGLDRRGHGRSDQPARGYETDTLADDVAALIDARALGSHPDRPFDRVRRNRALSDPARRRPRRARHPPCADDADAAEDRRQPERRARVEFEALWAQWKRDYPKWIADNVEPFFIPETSPAMMRWGAGLLQSPVPIALACARAMVEEDFRAEMRRIEVPTLLVHGDRDRSAPIEITGKPSAELIPGSRLLVYEGAPHGRCSPIWTGCTPTFCDLCVRPGAQRVRPNCHREFTTGLWSLRGIKPARTPLFGGAACRTNPTTSRRTDEAQ